MLTKLLRRRWGVWAANLTAVTRNILASRRARCSGSELTFHGKFWVQFPRCCRPHGALSSSRFALKREKDFSSAVVRLLSAWLRRQLQKATAPLSLRQPADLIATSCYVREEQTRCSSTQALSLPRSKRSVLAGSIRCWN